MKIRGKAHVFGDDINTDIIMPSSSHGAEFTMEELGRHAMAGVDPEFSKKVKPSDVLVAGENFGCGSSRETAPMGLKACGIGAIVAKSFARTFFRNCLNQGLPIMVCPSAVESCKQGSQVDIDLESGILIIDGKAHQSEPFPPFLLSFIRDGGIVGYAQRSLAERESPS